MFSASKTGAGASGYPIVNSLRFQAASSQFLSRTPAIAGNRQTWTYSTWIKLGSLSLGTQQFLLNAGPASDNERTQFTVDSNLIIGFVQVNGGSVVQNLNTTQVFRDPSAWYHIVLAVDTTQATASNRVKIYINGSQVTAFSTATYMAQNTNTYINNTTPHFIGKYQNGSGNPSDWYQTESILVDGQALTPSSFGQTDATTGQWIAKSYSGSYGTNGFFLKFANGTSTTTLGSDSSGNGNNWTLTNFTRSAGVSDCWMIDVPSGNSGVSATQPSSNYAVLNPVNVSGMSITRGNLSVSQTATAQGCRSTFLMTSGQWYWEVTNTTGSSFDTIGIVGESIALTADLTSASLAVAYYAFTGNRYVNGSVASYGATYTTGDVIGVAVDVTNNTVTFYKNGVSQGTITGLSLSTGSWYAANGNANNGSNTKNYNFGQRSFAYTPPSGFKALCTANLPASTIVKGNQYMDATTYTGTGSTQVITNSGAMSPDFVWLKIRSGASNHVLIDAVRGYDKYLSSNATTAEATSTDQFLSFNSNGFTLGANAGAGGNTNQSGSTYVAWQWDAGSSTVTNTSGSISSQVRANPTAGVSVVTYTGTGSAATVGHGLGVAPKMIIIKRRNGVVNWPVFNINIGNQFFLQLNTADNATNQSIIPGGNWWNNTNPTSSVFSIGTVADNNASGGTFVAYAFAEIAGFSRFGSYTGNGSADGPFVYTGFRPKFIMTKRTDTAGFWWEMIDTSRAPFNVANNPLYANVADSEYTGSVYDKDLLSNGFKMRGTNGGQNASGGTYIYMAFAENPLAQSNAR